MENEQNLVEEESILDSIDESSAENNSDDEYISMGALKDIRDGNYVHPNINTRDSRLRIHEKLGKRKVSGNERNSQKKGREHFYTRYMRLLKNN